MPDNPARLRQALAAGEWAADSARLAGYRSANPLAAGRTPAFAARPANVEELIALVREAAAAGVKLVPVSSAGPHRKGGIVCGEEHGIVDLSGWKKISTIDRRNRVCTLDPGVTYGELLAALGPHGLTAPLPLAPRSGKSVLAAVLDREPSTWPNKQWDVGDPLACAEIIFGTGDRFRTGAAGGPGSLEAQRASGGAQKAPLGPSQTDFHRLVQGAQGAMGIVSCITLRCELLPRRQAPRLVGSDRLEPLLDFTYRVQRPKLGEHCFLLDRNLVARLLGEGVKKAALPRWLLVQNIAGFERLPAERVAYQSADIAEQAQAAGVKLEERIGEISAEALLAAATRPADHDWRHDSLELFWLSTLDRAPQFLALWARLAQEHGVGDDYGVYLQPVVQNHGCNFEVIAPYDPARPEEVARMKALEAAATAALLKAGAFFSRPYGMAERAVFAANPPQAALLGKIKTIFDPHRVLAPGRFGL